MRKFVLILFAGLQIFNSNNASAQAADSISKDLTLEDCIRYALNHQPLLKQSQIDEEITENNIRNKLADWLPQVSANYNVQHFFQLPTAFIPDANGEKRPVQNGYRNTSNIQFSASQAIFNRDVLLASRTAGDVRQQARQQTVSNQIDVVTEVSKAFYDVLLSQRQVQVLDENIIRLRRSLQDAFNQYQGGIVDKIDYKRAQISLNNTLADRKRIAETIDSKLAYLKQLIGYSNPSPITIVYDSLQMERSISIDTLQSVQINNRIEYQQLQTQQRLLQSNLNYYRWSYLPNISAVGNYNPTFANDRFFSMYGAAYPSSFIGLQLSIPIFQGGKRIYNIRTANLQLQRIQWDMESVSNLINTQYRQALAGYKGNLAELNAMKENLSLANEVYETLRLQYSAGIKTYLDVIIAETDLRTTQLNYLNALFAVLSSKLDLQRALGTITY